jgi:hypothetical protein
MRLLAKSNRAKAQATIAEVRGLVGRDSMMAACLIASLPIAIIDNF